MREIYMTQEGIDQIDEKFQLYLDAARLLGLVVAEWKSDPQSVQCFDLRIVNEAEKVVKRLNELRYVID